jgi:hypothetical protein
VAAADTTGLVPVIALITILVVGFKYIGRARRAAETDKHEELFIWALGACLFANLVAFFGISYFDQTIVGWYAVLAMIAAVTLPARTAEREREAAAMAPDLVLHPSLASGAIRNQRLE